MQKIILDVDKINEIDLTDLNKYVEWHKENFKYFNLPAGKEHYKLLAYLSKTLKCNKLVEFGTYLGHGTIALSYDSNKTVQSYDIYSWMPEKDTVCAESKENVKLYIEDYMSNIPDIIKDCDLVFIDIDHTGATERVIMEELRKANYKGLVLLDDVDLNDQMRDFAKEIPEKKIDITKYGHWSGTLLCLFDESKFNIILE